MKKYTATESDKEIYAMIKSRVEKGSLVLRKCGCSDELFHSDSAYIQHLQESHSGRAPIYSSHLVQKGRLIVNEDFNQLIVAEELVTIHFYYCGFCEGSYFTNSLLLFCRHSEFLHNNARHPESSHFVVGSQGLKEEALRLLSLDYKKPRNIFEQIITQLEGPFKCDLC